MMTWMKLYQIPQPVKQYFNRRKLLRELFLSLENRTESMPDKELIDISARLSRYCNETLVKGITVTGYSQPDLQTALLLYLGISQEEFIHMMMKRD